MHETVELHLTIPPGPANEVIAEVHAGVEATERQVSEERKRTGARVCSDARTSLRSHGRTPLARSSHGAISGHALRVGSPSVSPPCLSTRRSWRHTAKRVSVGSRATLPSSRAARTGSQGSPPFQSLHYRRDDTSFVIDSNVRTRPRDRASPLHGAIARREETDVTSRSRGTARCLDAFVLLLRKETSYRSRLPVSPASLFGEEAACRPPATTSVPEYAISKLDPCVL